jgi:hypothetical protein
MMYNIVQHISRSIRIEISYSVIVKSSHATAMTVLELNRLQLWNIITIFIYMSDRLRRPFIDVMISKNNFTQAIVPKPLEKGRSGRDNGIYYHSSRNNVKISAWRHRMIFFIIIYQSYSLFYNQLLLFYTKVYTETYIDISIIFFFCPSYFLLSYISCLLLIIKKIRKRSQIRFYQIRERPDFSRWIPTKLLCYNKFKFFHWFQHRAICEVNLFFSTWLGVNPSSLFVTVNNLKKTT